MRWLFPVLFLLLAGADAPGHAFFSVGTYYAEFDGSTSITWNFGPDQVTLLDFNASTVTSCALSGDYTITITDTTAATTLYTGTHNPFCQAGTLLTQAINKTVEAGHVIKVSGSKTGSVSSANFFVVTYR